MDPKDAGFEHIIAMAGMLCLPHRPAGWIGCIVQVCCKSQGCLSAAMCFLRCLGWLGQGCPYVFPQILYLLFQRYLQFLLLRLVHMSSLCMLKVSVDIVLRLSRRVDRDFSLPV